jgi:uncharacterized 2Fe-2S/4Fe-4S cluster protein (DUF4445 family)
MPQVIFQPSSRSVEVSPGTELLEAAREAGVEIEAPCGGKGRCGRCLVRVGSDAVDSDSLSVMPAAAVAQGLLLACRTRVADQAVVVEIPEQEGRHGGQISEEDETWMVRGELLPQEWQFDPLAVKWPIEVPPAQPDDGLSDVDRFIRAIKLEWGRREKLPVDSFKLFADLESMLIEVKVPLGTIRALAHAIRAGQGRVTASLVRTGRRMVCVRVEPGHSEQANHAIAVDVGTTTVTVQLVDLGAARIVATRSAYNDQVACGGDIISRIEYARRDGGLAELRARVLGTVNGLLDKACRSCKVDPHSISNAVISGNTTMTHLLLGLNPEYIRLEPYTPTLLEMPYLTASEVGIDINPESWIHFSPNVGSYVGGDITAGLLCTDLASEGEALGMLIDIGTNGELVVGNQDFLLCCACSAGPAFEGGGIEHGMRASIGAIERVAVDPASGAPSWTTIGDAPPRGICGSGMIDLLANLFRNGWLDPAGQLDRSRPCPHIQHQGKRARYVIVPEEQSATGRPIAIDELDIENILRAKAAIYSACALMLEQVGIDFEDLEQVSIAGGFGRSLDLEQAVTIGLIPDIPRERFRFVGNSSLIGSYMVVVSREFRRRQEGLAGRMTYFDLSAAPGYMDQYTAALFLPHTDPSRFPSLQRTPST